MKKATFLMGFLFLAMVSLIASGFYNIIHAPEQPFLTVYVYRDSVSYQIGTYQHMHIDTVYNMYNNNYQITITKLSR